MLHSPKYSEIYSRATKYCAAQERCVKQVSNKLFEWKVGSDDADQIIDRLQKENYINEERFARAAQIENPAPELLMQLSHYREMIEEFKVSLFAQELGTAFPVSAKRLDKKWGELEPFC